MLWWQWRAKLNNVPERVLKQPAQDRAQAAHAAARSVDRAPDRLRERDLDRDRAAPAGGRILPRARLQGGGRAVGAVRGRRTHGRAARTHVAMLETLRAPSEPPPRARDAAAVADESSSARCCRTARVLARRFARGTAVRARAPAPAPPAPFDSARRKRQRPPRDALLADDDTFANGRPREKAARPCRAGPARRARSIPHGEAANATPRVATCRAGAPTPTEAPRRLDARRGGRTRAGWRSSRPRPGDATAGAAAAAAPPPPRPERRRRASTQKAKGGCACTRSRASSRRTRRGGSQLQAPGRDRAVRRRALGHPHARRRAARARGGQPPRAARARRHRDAVAAAALGHRHGSYLDNASPEAALQPAARDRVRASRSAVLIADGGNHCLRHPRPSGAAAAFARAEGGKLCECRCPCCNGAARQSTSTRRGASRCARRLGLHLRAVRPPRALHLADRHGRRARGLGRRGRRRRLGAYCRASRTRPASSSDPTARVPADLGNHCVRRINPTTGHARPSPAARAASARPRHEPRGSSSSAARATPRSRRAAARRFVADSQNCRIRMLDMHGAR